LGVQDFAEFDLVGALFPTIERKEKKKGEMARDFFFSHSRHALLAATF
jgi:hypothetical protein